jgi:hypothetical protein
MKNPPRIYVPAGGPNLKQQVRHENLIPFTPEKQEDESPRCSICALAVAIYGSAGPHQRRLDNSL